jgi:hypothetical protein
MKTAKLTLMFLACAAASAAFAQNTTDARCGTTNFDSSQNMFTITNRTPGTATQQCFITVVPKASWNGGVPDLASSLLIEGNYEVVLAGGGGHGGSSEVPATTVRYLTPGVYRLTIGTGGRGGASKGGRGGDGAPTSLSNASTGETIAGFSRAESWSGSSQYAQGDNSAGTGLAPMAYSPRISGKYRWARCRRWDQRWRKAGGHGGGNGFIKLALKDPVPKSAQIQAQTAQMQAAEMQDAHAKVCMIILCPCVRTLATKVTISDSAATRPARGIAPGSQVCSPAR